MTEKITRRDFIKFAGLGLATFAGYKIGNLVERNKIISENEINMVSKVAKNDTTSVVTDEKTKGEIIPGNPDTSTAIPSLDISKENFNIGPFFPNLPFEIKIPNQVVPGFGGSVIRLNDTLVSDENKLPLEKSNKFADYIGYPASSLSYLTTDPNTKTHFGTLMHSEGKYPAETFRLWTLRLDTSVLIGKEISLVQETPDFGKMEMIMRISDLRIVSEAEFYNSVKRFTDPKKPQFINLEQLGVPSSTTIGNLCVTFVYCVNDFVLDSNGQIVPGEYGMAQTVANTFSNRRGLLTCELQKIINL